MNGYKNFDNCEYPTVITLFWLVSFILYLLYIYFCYKSYADFNIFLYSVYFIVLLILFIPLYFFILSESKKIVVSEMTIKDIKIIHANWSIGKSGSYINSYDICTVWQGMFTVDNIVSGDKNYIEEYFIIYKFLGIPCKSSSIKSIFYYKDYDNFKCLQNK